LCRWWCEIADMGRKLMLTGIMVFVEPDSSIQVAIGCLLNFAMLMASLKIQPLYDPLVDAANNIAFLELYLTLFLGLLFRVSAVSDDAGESELFTLVVAVLGAFIFVYPAVGLMLFSRRSRTTVTPPKSPLVKAVTKTVSGFFKKTTPKADAAPAEPKAEAKQPRGEEEVASAETKDEEAGTTPPRQLSPAAANTMDELPMPPITAEMSPNPAYGISSSDSSLAL
jgi:hypothetical protein